MCLCSEQILAMLNDLQVCRAIDPRRQTWMSSNSSPVDTVN